jgi:hypothetical protein
VPGLTVKPKLVAELSTVTVPVIVESEYDDTHVPSLPDTLTCGQVPKPLPEIV